MIAIDNDRKALCFGDESSATHPSVFPSSPQEFLIKFEEYSMLYQRILNEIRMPIRKTKGMNNSVAMSMNYGLTAIPISQRI